MQHDDVLSGEGLRLRPFASDDPSADDMLRVLAADAASRQWSRSLRAIHAEGSAREWIHRRLRDDASREWVIEDAAGGRLLGRVGLRRPVPDGDPGIGFWTLPSERGRGVARRATRLVARHAHQTLGEARIDLRHAVGNPASCRVAFASSFGFEGTVRGGDDTGDGVRRDLHLHGRLAADPWEPIPIPVPAGGPPRLVGDGVVLRPWRPDDVGFLAAASADPLIAQWSPFRVATEADLTAYLQRMSLGLDGLGWAVTDGDTVLGYVSLHRINAEGANCEAGYWVGPQARGRGVATRALRTVTAYGFQRLDLERIEVFHAVENVRSCRVADRAGFDLEGVRRKGWRYHDGLLHDEHQHARVRGS